jgi:hypothetical protein
MGPSGRDSYTSRYGEVSLPYNAKAHLDWLLGLPQVKVRLEQLRLDAANPRRRAGLPWREYGFLDVEGDAAAIRRWQGEQRQLSYLLPPKMRGLVPVLVRDPGAPIEVSMGWGLSRDRAERLQAFCLRKLTRGSPPLSNAERQQLYRDLRALDPGREPLLILDGARLPRGATAAVCATSAARGLWIQAEPKPAYPIVGVVATHLASGAGVDLFRLENPPSATTEKFEFFR